MQVYIPNIYFYKMLYKLIGKAHYSILKGYRGIIGSTPPTTAKNQVRLCWTRAITMAIRIAAAALAAPANTMGADAGHYIHIFKFYSILYIVYL